MPQPSLSRALKTVRSRNHSLGWRTARSRNRSSTWKHRVLKAVRLRSLTRRDRRRRLIRPRPSNPMGWQ